MPKKRNFSGYLKGRIDEDSGDLSTLATETGIVVIFDETVNGRTLVSSIVVAVSVEDLAGGDGPLEVGVAHSDYTLAEIEEYIENTGSWNAGNKISSREIGRRLIRSIATLDPQNPSAFGGAKRKVKLNWMLEAGQTLDLWVYNHGDQMTTGAIVYMHGHANLWAR